MFHVCKLMSNTSEAINAQRMSATGMLLHVLHHGLCTWQSTTKRPTNSFQRNLREVFNLNKPDLGIYLVIVPNSIPAQVNMILLLSTMVVMSFINIPSPRADSMRRSRLASRTRRPFRSCCQNKIDQSEVAQGISQDAIEPSPLELLDSLLSPTTDTCSLALLILKLCSLALLTPRQSM